MTSPTTDMCTLAKVDGGCELVLIPAYVEEHATVPCPNTELGDHEHQVLRVEAHIQVVQAVQIGDTVHIFID